jgi:hypothetical protein
MTSRRTLAAKLKTPRKIIPEALEKPYRIAGEVFQLSCSNVTGLLYQRQEPRGKVIWAILVGNMGHIGQ